MMKQYALITFMLFAAAIAPCRADSLDPRNYKKAIETIITSREALKHPEFAQLRFSFFAPKEAHYEGKSRQAVHCEWYAEDKKGVPYLMVAEADFLVDLGLVCEVLPGEELGWISGKPVREKNGTEPLANPTAPFVTPTAEQMEPKK
ncbi:MAG TPA: hypothetical protein VFE25_05425 [Opitutaceae bacterium]|jgi:hypothetical protein|nr:hypothetical protein [Opitutaceae bacterium]